VEGMRSLLGEESVYVFDPEMKVGDAVQITAGAFQGLEAVVTQLMPGKERVKVLFEFLGRQTVAEVESGKLLHMTPAREATMPAAGNW
jgi:transcriptional antiterminator RfaH